MYVNHQHKIQPFKIINISANLQVPAPAAEVPVPGAPGGPRPPQRDGGPEASQRHPARQHQGGPADGHARPAAQLPGVGATARAAAVHAGAQDGRRQPRHRSVG